MTANKWQKKSAAARQRAGNATSFDRPGHVTGRGRGWYSQAATANALEFLGTDSLLRAAKSLERKGAPARQRKAR
jgi:hypothetical protein